MKPGLLHISYSPWSERARWALQIRGVDFQPRAYQPLLGEPELRWRLRNWQAPVSVPVLLTDAGPIADSYAIAQYASRHGDGPDLFPAGHDAAIAAWNAQSEEALAAGRALSLERVLQMPDALLEMVPKALRGIPGAQALAAAGVRRTLAKYKAPKAGNRETLKRRLETLRADLARSPRTSEPRTLLAQFSYADITMAQVLAFVCPPMTGLRIGQANRAAFTDSELMTEFNDLLIWRDALYAAHRSAA